MKKKLPFLKQLSLLVLIFTSSIAMAVPMVGTYTINAALPASGTNYTSFTTAAADLTLNGVSGPVIFDVAAGTYTEQVTLGAIAGASALNTVTFQGNSANIAAATLTYSPTGSSDNWTMRFDGASYIDVKWLTIAATGATYARAVFFDNSNDHITFFENELKSIVSTSSNAAIVYNESGSSSLTSYCLFDGNTFTDGGYGAYWYGGSTTVKEVGNQFMFNTFNNYGLYGLYFYYQADGLISNNTILGNTASTTSSYGIYTYYTDTTSITSNKIVLSGTSTQYGIYASNLKGTASNHCAIVNNMITTSANATSSTIYGIYPYNGYNVDVFHNSVNVLAGSTTAGRALYLNSSSSGTYGSVSVRNNIFSSPGGTMAVEVSSGAAILGYATLNYNNYYSTATDVFKWSGTGSSTLASWQTASSGDANSLQTDPVYLAADDLHVIGTTVNDVGDNAVGVTVDFDGDTRPYTGATTVDMGADEFAPASCTQSSGLMVNTLTATTANVSWVSTSGATAWSIEYGPTGYTQGAGTTVAAGTNPYTITGLTAQTTYDFYVRDNCGGGNGNSAWTGPMSFTTYCTTQLSGTVTIDPLLPASSTNFQSFGTLLSELSQCGISGPLTINVAAGTYSGAIYFSEIIGASATNTITFNGTDAATTTITHDGTSQNAAIQFDGADYIAFKNFTIANTATSNGWGVHFKSEANYNTIDSCIVNVDMGTNSSVVGILASGSNTSTSTTGNNANNTTISNTTVNGGYYGIRFYGLSSSAAENLSNAVINCNVNTYYYGIYFYYQGEPTATGNIVTLSNTSSGYVLYCGYARHMTFTGNTLLGGRTYSLYLTQCNTSTQNATQRALIANNMITALGSGDGIYLSSSDDIDIFYNTITAENDQALWINSSSDNYDVRNNIFSVSGSTYIIDLDGAPDTLTDVIDYNIYYISGSGSIAQVVGTNYATLAAWQTGDVARNVNSLEGDPSFFSPTDLHLAGTLADNVGTPISGITEDIDGDTRSLTTPDIGADEYTAPSCSPPGSLMASNILATTADFGWTAGSTETMWDVEYDTTGFTQGAGTLITNTTTNPYSATGLTPNSSYDFYVRAKCGGSSSPWIGPFTFTTACSAFIAPYTENFDGLTLSSPYTDLPSCWEAQVGPDYWDVTNNSTNSPQYLSPSLTGDHTSDSTNYMWIDASSDILANEMVTPLIDMSGLTAPYAGFWFASDNITNNVNHTIALDAWDGTTWVNIVTERGNFTGWVEVAAAVPSTVPSITKFRIYAIADTGTTSGTYYYNDLGVDDFFVMETPACAAPTALGVTNLTSTSADVYFTPGGAANFNIEYGITGFTQGAGTMMSATNDTVSISSLTPNTSYSFYAQDSCSSTSVSAWAGPFTFFTGYCTPAPSSVDGTGITNVTMGTINNTTSNETGNYGDYSAMIADIAQGTTANVAITFSTSIYDYGTKIWVDWNDDLDFDDAGELVYTGLSGTSSPNTLNASFPVPLTAAFGNHRMRIGGTDNNAGPSDPCYTGSYGTFEDYTVNVLAAPTCIPPTMLGVISTTSASADVYWTTGGASAWVIEYGMSGFAQGAGTTMAATNDTTTIGSLTANTAYDFYVRDNCGAGDSSAWVGPISFTTLCNTFTAPFSEDFETLTGTSGCWTQEQVTGTKAWTLATGSTGGSITTANSGTLNMQFTSSSGGPHITKLVSPVIDASALTSGTLKFAYGQETWTPDQNYLNVYYRDSANGAWNWVWADSTNKAVWTLDSIAIPSASATLQIAFEGVDNYGRGVVIDDVELFSGSCGNWDVEINATDGLAALAGAQVVLNGDTMLTNATGNTLFQNLPNGSYPYSIMLGCYTTVYDTVVVDCGNEMRTDTLSMLTFDANINVTDGTVALQNAMVVLNGDTTMTDASGDAMFMNLPNGTYIYTISKTCYVSMTDTVMINCDDESMMNALMMDSIASSSATSICKGDSIVLGTQVISTAGVYVEVFASAMGCDSTVTLMVAVDSVDNTITANGLILSANLAGGTYQWIDCTTQMAITGATSQSYTAMSNGSYAVVVSDGTCSDTSACISITDFGIDKYGLGDFGLYPNPSDGKFVVDNLPNTGGKITVEVVNLTGVVIYKNEVLPGTNNSLEIDLRGYAPGMYQVRVSNNAGSGTKAFVLRN